MAGLLIAAAVITLTVSEFRSHTINVSLLAVPDRRFLFAGKAIVVTNIGAAVGVFGVFGAAGGLLCGWLILAGSDKSLDFSNATLWANMFAVVAILVAFSWTGFAFALLTHSTLGSMMLVFAVIFGPAIVDGVGFGLDWFWLRQVGHGLPGLLLNTATTTLASTESKSPAIVPPIAASFLLLSWGALFLFGGLVRFRKL